MKCKKCNGEFPIEMMETRKPPRKPHQCKECAATYMRERRKSKPTIYHVYYLPSHDYVGMTMDVVTRMSHHRKTGKNTDDMILLADFDCPIDAHLLETKLHKVGFEGFYY